MKTYERVLNVISGRRQNAKRKAGSCLEDIRKTTTLIKEVLNAKT